MKKHKKNNNKNQKRSFRQLTLDDRIKVEIRYRDGWKFRSLVCHGKIKARLVSGANRSSPADRPSRANNFIRGAIQVCIRANSLRVKRNGQKRL